MGKAAGDFDAGFLGLEFGLRMGKVADAHDAEVPPLACAWARQLMLMMLGFRGGNA